MSRVAVAYFGGKAITSPFGVRTLVTVEPSAKVLVVVVAPLGEDVTCVTEEVPLGYVVVPTDFPSPADDRVVVEPLPLSIVEVDDPPGE